MKMSKRDFLKNKNAVSEEFTILPALTIVIIGFTLFMLILTNVYNAYNNRIDSIDKYQAASFISTKLTNPDCYFILEGGRVNLPLLDSSNPKESDEKLQKMRDELKTSELNFSIHIKWDDEEKYFPKASLNPEIGNRIAVSKTVSIFLNEAQTKPGKLTVIMWSDYS